MGAQQQAPPQAAAPAGQYQQAPPAGAQVEGRKKAVLVRPPHACACMRAVCTFVSLDSMRKRARRRCFCRL